MTTDTELRALALSAHALSPATVLTLLTRLAESSKQTCSHLCATPKSIEDDEDEVAERIADYVQEHATSPIATAARIRGGAWRHYRTPEGT